MWRLLLVVFLCLFLSNALAQVTLQFTSPAQVVNPGENLTLVVTVQNNSGEQIRAGSEVELPEGWQPVIPLGQLVLAPGAQQVIPFVVQTNPGSPPGEHEVTIQIEPLGDDEYEPVVASQTVEVATVVDLGISAINTPRVVVAQSFTFQAQVTNNGNTPAAVRVEATSSINAAVTAMPNRFTIRPGESRQLDLEVTDLSQLDRARRQFITLSLYREGHAEQVARQVVSVERVPSVLPETSAYRLYPIDLTARAGGGLQERSFTNGTFSVVAVGSGALAEDGSDRLNFRISERLLQPYSQNYIRYSRGTFQGTVGDVYLAPAGFARSVRGPGVHLGTDLDVPGFQRVRAQLIAAYPEAPQLAANLNMVLNESLTLQPFTTVSPDHGAHGLTAHLQTGSDEEIRLRVSPALGLAHGGEVHRLDIAAELQAQATWSGNRFRVSSEYRDDSWSQGDGPTWDNSFQVQLRLDQFAAQPPFQGLALPETRLELRYVAGHTREPNETVWTSDDRFDLGVNSRLSWGTLDLSYQMRSGREWLHHEVVGVASNLDVGPFTVAGRIDWSQRQALEPAAGEMTESWGVQLSGTTSFLSGIFGSRVNARISAAPLELDQLSLVAQWEGPLGAGLQLDVGTEYRLRGYRLLDTEAGLEVSLRDGSTVGLGGTLRLFREREPALGFWASYTYPFDVRLGLRSDIGAVYGRVTDASGEPLPDLIVSIAGNSTSTDAQGNFRFPAVEEGERYLQIMPGQLPGDWSVAPANLIPVVVVPGEEHRVDMQAAPTAQVQGRFVYQASQEAQEDVILGMAGPAAGERAVAGIRVQARMGERVRTVSSDPDGNFRFEMLPHGEWQLSVSAPELEGYYRLEPSIVQMELAPGEEREIEISVIPVPRRLQIFDGGTIGVP